MTNNQEIKRIHQGYTKATPKLGLFSLKQLLQKRTQIDYSNITPTLLGKMTPLREKCLVRSWSELGRFLQNHFVKIYLYLIFPGYFFMLCCQSNNL